MTALAPSPLGEAVCSEFDALLEYGFEVPEVIAAIGKSYGAVRKIAIRQGRVDLVAALSAWRVADAERLRFARGAQWQ